MIANRFLQLLAGLPDKTIAPLQRVQNACARLTLRKGRSTSSSLLLKELGWLPVKQRITFKTVALAFRCRYFLPLSLQNTFLLFSLPMCPRVLLDTLTPPLSPSFAVANPLMARYPSPFSHPPCSTPYLLPYQGCPTSPRLSPSLSPTCSNCRSPSDSHGFFYQDHCTSSVICSMHCMISALYQ